MDALTMGISVAFLREKSSSTGEQESISWLAFLMVILTNTLPHTCTQC